MTSLRAQIEGYFTPRISRLRADAEDSVFDERFLYASMADELEQASAEILALVDAAEREGAADAARWRYCLTHSAWIRGDERDHDYMAVLVPKGSDLSCVATRQDAVDAARAARTEEER